MEDGDSIDVFPTTDGSRIFIGQYIYISGSVHFKNSPVKGWGGLSKMSKNVKMSIHPTTHRWEWIHKSKIVKGQLNYLD